MTFYLKYRSQTLNELDLTNVRESLIRIVKSGNIPHALLFSGPKGTGKTSAARILAKVVNCEYKNKKEHTKTQNEYEPCNKCYQCTSIAKGENLDVVELDAASHRGIDDVRILRETVKTAPVKAKMKVYIIDEAHMLTTEASNALLKTLEEPPSHVMFILATTNPEKLIDTIRSRCTQIKFTKASDDELIRALSRVVKGEELKVEKGVLSAIAGVSDGSFRDAIKILEQAVSEGVNLDLESVSEYLFAKSSFDVERILKFLAQGHAKPILEDIEKSIEKGVSVKSIIAKLIDRLREALLTRLGIDGRDLEIFSIRELIQLIESFSKAYAQTLSSLIEQLPLEIAIVEWCNDKEGVKDGKGQSEEAGTTNSIKNYPKRKEKEELQGIKQAALNGQIEGVWGEILSQIRPINASTEALLRAAKPMEFDGKNLTLGVYYRFHKERLESSPHRNILEDVIAQVSGLNVRVVCKLTEQPAKKEEASKDGEQDKTDGFATPQKTQSDAVLAEAEDEDIIKVAKEIFGS